MRLLAVPALAVLLLAPASARADPAADPQPALHWDEDRPRFRPAEYVVTAVVGAAAWDMYYWLPSQPEPHWIGGILFDDAVRNAIRLRSPAALQTDWAFSDAVDGLLVGLVMGVDGFIVPLARGSSDVAIQVSLMNAESFALSSVVTFSLYDSVGRARPSYEDCQRNHGGPGCNTSPTASFPSGHTAEAFTAAGMSCANHAYLPLYNSAFWDAFACARDLTLAATDAVLRMMGDRHYLTDTLVGGLIGFGFGYGLPTVLHYRASTSRHALSWTVSPLVGSQQGVAVVGAF